MSQEKQAVYQGVITFAGFEKTLIVPAASGVLSYDAGVMQSREHNYVNPVCLQSPGTRPGIWGQIVRRVP